MYTKQVCNASVLRWCCQSPQCYSNFVLKRYSFPELYMYIALANALFQLVTYVEKCITAHSEILYPNTRGKCILHNLVPPVPWSVQCPHFMWHLYSHYLISNVAKISTNLAFFCELRPLNKESLRSDDSRSLLCRLLAKASACNHNKSLGAVRDTISMWQSNTLKSWVV